MQYPLVDDACEPTDLVEVDHTRKSNDGTTFFHEFVFMLCKNISNLWSVMIDLRAATISNKPTMQEVVTDYSPAKTVKTSAFNHPVYPSDPS